MTTALLAPLVVALEEPEKINHWFVGLIAIGILLALLGVMVAFGGGLEHS